ncbi:hypothetical protein ADL02_43870 [Streptomyces sp. NRRL WC-3723]|nr:hypothetical protein ADL02_43870 [Streptomyces sp. NRRL WC-3723]
MICAATIRALARSSSRSAAGDGTIAWAALSKKTSATPVRKASSTSTGRGTRPATMYAHNSYGTAQRTRHDQGLTRGGRSQAAHRAPSPTELIASAATSRPSGAVRRRTRRRAQHAMPRYPVHRRIHVRRTDFMLSFPGHR